MHLPGNDPVRVGICWLGLTAISLLFAISAVYELLMNKVNFHGHSYVRVLIRREKILQILSVVLKKIACLKLE